MRELKSEDVTFVVVQIRRTPHGVRELKFHRNGLALVTRDVAPRMGCVS